MTLSFKLPEEEKEMQLCINAWKWKSVVEDLDQFLRNKIKYAEKASLITEVYDIVRSQLHNLLSEERLELHD